ncbi:hypothetical protein [uncultured Aquimarina sp.]|uniref:hypothetical protein n=1 Tax=uncultured Aquimarina sp. TaxID=575652 RepID=UPI002632C54A|nr:hypothetical protein [uncultured Aquimarina sp.]
MSDILKTVKSLSSTTSVPKRLEIFYLSEADEYNDASIANLPGWDPSCEFDLDFSADTVEELMERHSDWITRESESDQCQYIAFSTLEDETDFLVVNISDEDCPVYFGNHETGDFQMIYKSLDRFVKYLDSEDINPMELFGELYEKSQTAFFDGNEELVVTLLGDFFDQYPMNPAIPGPYMKQIPDALNLLACSYVTLDRTEEAMEAFELACTGMFCRNAFLNRIRLNLISSEYDVAMQLCDQGLNRFSDSYSTSFINLYKGVIHAVLEKEEDGRACLALMNGDVEKTDFNIVTPVAAIFIHYTAATDFEEVFNQTLQVIREAE